MLLGYRISGSVPEILTRASLRLKADRVRLEVGRTARVPDSEVVLVGAHLDSWHTATGATDNADGVATVMEAMRILAAIDAVPRRTIRAVLWGGEVQGLLGARAWVAQHRNDELGRIAVYVNDDPGTGKTYGFYMEQSTAAKKIFDGWLAPLRRFGARRNVIEGIGSTDHVPFVEQGVPAFPHRLLVEGRWMPGKTVRARHSRSE